jgi:hypothetical protein
MPRLDPYKPQNPPDLTLSFCMTQLVGCMVKPSKTGKVLKQRSRSMDGYFLLALLAQALVATAYTLRGSIDPSVLPLSVDDISATKFVLANRQTSSTMETYFNGGKGDFIFSNLTEGSYILTVESVPFEVDGDFRIDIAPGQVEVYRIFTGHDANHDMGPRVSYPIVISPMSRRTYTIVREGFSLLNMLKSPMMLMSIASLVVVFALPKMAANIDPEALQQLQDQQNRSNDAMDAVSNFDIATFMAGKSRTK